MRSRKHIEIGAWCWTAALGVLAVAACGCSDACESHDDCSHDEYCDASADEDGRCVERKAQGESCRESRECASDLACAWDDRALATVCRTPTLIDWGGAMRSGSCAAAPTPAEGDSHGGSGPLAFAAIFATLASRTRHRPSLLRRRAP